jgi:hypothetical protein
MEGYKPFVLAFNYALQALQKINLPSPASVAELDLLFHRNDPELILATHNDHLSQRKPDIVLVFLEVARNAFSQGDLGAWTDFALRTATTGPKNKFTWEDPLCALEFKRTQPTLSSPPAVYTVKPAENFPPQSLPSLRGIFEDAEDPPATASRETLPKPLEKPVVKPSKPLITHR